MRYDVTLFARTSLVFVPVIAV